MKMRLMVFGCLWVCLALVLAAVLCGCAGAGQVVIGEPSFPPAGVVKPAAAVFVSLERVDPAAYGGWSGPLGGVRTDEGRALAEWRAKYGGFSYEIRLTNSTATVYRFLRSVAAASTYVKGLGGGLVFVFYSGHGGQVPDTGGDEPDGMDETLCLWDGQLTDDVMWDAVCLVPEGVCLAFFSDSCNSATQWKSQRDWGRVVRARASREPGRLKCRLLFLAGCGDGESSYETDGRGGAFTYASFVEAPPRGRTWRAWFEAAAGSMPRNQRPVMSEAGESFADAPALEAGRRMRDEG